jgi:hypothetical protein
VFTTPIVKLISLGYDSATRKTFMNTKIVGLIAALGLLVPALSLAQMADVGFSTNPSYASGTLAEFNVTINNYAAVGNLTSVITFDSSSSKDISSFEFLDSAGWVKVTLVQSGTDYTGNFTSKTGFLVGDKRIITMRANFKTAKTYVVGYALKLGAQVVASAAQPILVTGKILGEVTPPAAPTAPGIGTFTRRLAVGLAGADVTALQNKLTAEGYYTGPITGYFGAQTKAAVIKYQTAHGISAIGTVGPQTLAALNQ